MLAINSTFFCWATVNASANCQKCDDKLFDQVVLLGPKYSGLPFSSVPIILCAFSLELGENVPRVHSLQQNSYWPKPDGFVLGVMFLS